MAPSPSPLNNPAILVAYATSTGTTREIAERIASTLQTTTSWRVDCKPVNEIHSLHKELHCRRPAPAPKPALLPAEVPPAPTATPVVNGNGTPLPGEDHTIHPNPLSALISNEAGPEAVEYKAIVIGSSIHAGKWLSSGRGFIHHNRDFFAGKCCNTPPAPLTADAKKPVKGKGGWATLWGISVAQAAAHQQEPEPAPEAEPVQEVAKPPVVIPKIYAFSVGMPGNDDALASEEKSVEAALRKELGKVPSPGANAHGVEEDEILQRHVLFRGMWSPKQIEILAPRFVSRFLNWCIPKDSKFFKEDDERDWKGIEAWAVGVGKEIMGVKGEEEEGNPTAAAATA